MVEAYAKGGTCCLLLGDKRHGYDDTAMPERVKRKFKVEHYGYPWEAENGI